MKRILVIAGIIVAALAIIGLGVWLRGATTGGGPNATPLPSGTLPLPDPNSSGVGTNAGGPGGSNAGPVPSGSPTGVIAVSQTSILDYAVNASGTLLMATPAGTIVKLEGSESVLGQSEFGEVSGAWFSPDGRWLLTKSGSVHATRWSIFDTARNTWRDLPANTSEMFWSPTGNLLAYFARRSDGSTLTIHDVARNTSRSALSLSASDLTLRWKDLSRVTVLERPTALIAGTAWEVNLSNGGVSVFALNVIGGDILWSGAREQGLLFRGAAQGGTLSLVDSSGAASANLNFLTLPSKCVFGDVATATSSAIIGDHLFCAIPQDANALRTRRLPDEYLKRQFGTVDTWYAANTLNGALRQVLPNSVSQNFAFDAMNAKIYDTQLYFMNRNDQKLYRISLEEMARI